MTTAIKTPSPAVPATAPATVDLDTRLAIASAGMDALLNHVAGPELAAAHEAATAAVQDAQSTVDLTPVFSPSPVLARARQLIETRGWARHAYQAPGGQVCAMAAIREVLYGPDWTYQASDQRERDAAGELMRRIKDDTGTAFSVPAWNDSRGSVADVVRLLY